MSDYYYDDNDYPSQQQRRSSGSSSRQGTRRSASGQSRQVRSRSQYDDEYAGRSRGASSRRGAGTSRQASTRRSAGDGQRRSAQRSSSSRKSAQRSSAARATGMRQTATPDPRRRAAQQRQSQSNLAPLLACLLVVAIVGGAILVLLHPWKYNVTVNGTEVTVKRNASINDVIEAGYASPKPGNLIAVDGSMAKEGGGDIFSGTVNGAATNDPETVLKKGDVVEIADGADAPESFSSTEETVPHGERAWDTDINSYWTGSLHVYMAGEDGLRVTKTGDVSGITVTEQTKDPVDSGYTIYTCNPGEDKVVALTFDDGPWDTTTDQILDVLEENGAKATFFTIGEQIAEHSSQVQRANSLGCQVCTHTWDHASGSGQGVNLTYMSAEEQINEIEKGYEAIRNVLGEEPTHVVRAPGGNFYGDIISTLAPYLDAEVGWDVDTEDWRMPGADAIYSAIMSVQPGQVVLMHDGGGDRSQTVEAVRQAVPELIAQGYRLVTVSELLAYGLPGAEPEVTQVG